MPRSPNTLLLDTSAPLLQRWYIDRKSIANAQSHTISLYLYFNEPVRLVNAALFQIYYSTTTTLNKIGTIGTVPYSIISPATIANQKNSNSSMTTLSSSYDSLNRIVIIQLENYCLDNSNGNYICDGSDSNPYNQSSSLFDFLNQPTTASTAASINAASSISKYNYFLAVSSSVVSDSKSAAAIAIEDFAKKPNSLSPINERFAVKEGAPGKCYE